MTQVAFARHTNVQQATVSRWFNGVVVPNKAGDVADFARRLGRNPIEAYVAAGMLTEDEAGRALKPSERRLLDELRRVA